MDEEHWFDSGIQFDGLDFEFEAVVATITPRPLFDMRKDFTTLVEFLFFHTTLDLDIQVIEKRWISSPTDCDWGSINQVCFNHQLKLRLTNPYKSLYFISLFAPMAMRGLLAIVFVILPLIAFVDITVIIQCEEQ